MKDRDRDSEIRSKIKVNFAVPGDKDRELRGKEMKKTSIKVREKRGGREEVGWFSSMRWVGGEGVKWILTLQRESRYGEGHLR